MKLLPLLLLLSVASPQKQSPKGVFNHALLSIVKITFDAGEEGTHYCTGFIIDSPRGWVITARHCVSDTTQNYINESLPVEVVKTTDDLAIVEIPAMMGPPLEFEDDTDVLDEVVSIGYGNNHMQAIDRHVAGFDKGDIILDGPLTPGMSGGPIVDLNGKVVGLNQYTYPSVGVGCGVKEMKDFIKSKPKHKKD